jgi:hypothetical protein
VIRQKVSVNDQAPMVEEIRRHRTELTIEAIRFSALSSPHVAQASHIDHGGNQNQPPSASPMIAAVPLSASAAVNRQIRAALSSWPVLYCKRLRHRLALQSRRTFERRGRGHCFPSGRICAGPRRGITRAKFRLKLWLPSQEYDKYDKNKEGISAKSHFSFIYEPKINQR